MEACTPSSLIGCPWMEWAYLALGERAVPGVQHNPTIQDFLRYCGVNAGDETAWCSAFANWCMEQAGIRGTRRANARSWLDWGDSLQRYTPLNNPAFGCVTVLWRDNLNSWKGHVGFCVGREGGNLLLLGGNQTGSAVTIQPYAVNRVLGHRWPPAYPVMHVV